jgi:hypothetical protein
MYSKPLSLTKSFTSNTRRETGECATLCLPPPNPQAAPPYQSASILPSLINLNQHVDPEKLAQGDVTAHCDVLTLLRVAFADRQPASDALRYNPSRRRQFARSRYSSQHPKSPNDLSSASKLYSLTSKGVSMLAKAWAGDNLTSLSSSRPVSSQREAPSAAEAPRQSRADRLASAGTSREAALSSRKGVAQERVSEGDGSPSSPRAAAEMTVA